MIYCERRETSSRYVHTWFVVYCVAGVNDFRSDEKKVDSVAGVATGLVLMEEPFQTKGLHRSPKRRLARSPSGVCSNQGSVAAGYWKELLEEDRLDLEGFQCPHCVYKENTHKV